MIPGLFFAAALFLTGPPAPANSSAATYYRVDLSGGQTAWAIGKPQPNGQLLLFRHFPEGSLMSVRARDVKRVVAGLPPEAVRRLNPGETVVIGATGGGSASGASAGAGRAAAAGTEPGARKDGSALFNPARAYNPTWDSKLVPGQTMGYPNSPNDYMEGRTLGFPPAPAVQSAPGDVPRAPEPHN